jgi:hypothetical protein
MVKTLIKVSENIVVLIMHLFYLLQFSGTYCIYSAAISPYICPTSEGRLFFGYGYWDNQLWLNDSEMKGVLPGGYSVRGGRTGIYFCCQGSKDPNIPMLLPIDQPFYLLAFKSSVCQKVEWATVSPEFVLYDTSDYRNKDKFTPFSPFNATKHDPKIHYCYYEGLFALVNSILFSKTNLLNYYSLI